MADILLPTHLNHARVSFRYLDSTGLSIGEFTGYPRTASKGGDRVAASIEYVPHGGPTQRAEAAQLRHAIQQLRGKQNRVYLFDQSYTRRGSFPASELLSNNTFANGTTDWTPVNGAALSVADRLMRVAVTFPSPNVEMNQSLSGLTQYAPYALRAFFIDGAQTAGLNMGPALASGVVQTQDYGLARGMKTTAQVVLATTGTAVPIVYVDVSGFTAGAHIICPYTSLSRCILADGGGNAFQRSDEIDNAYWTKNALTVNANFHTAPDGTATAERLVENTANDQHYFTRDETRASAVEDWCIEGVFARSSGTRDVRLVIGRDASANFSTCIFDLNAGTAGTPTNAGDNSNARAFTRSMGNGYTYCALVARLAASTQVTAYVNMVNAGNSVYTGDGSSAITAWRVGAARSSVPLKLGQTTTAAASAVSQTGTGIHVKGLPVSTEGLLEIGDWVAPLTAHGYEFKMVVARLNSDAAGLGFLQLLPPVRGALANDAPIIVHQPMGRFICMTDAPGWENEPGVFTRASLEFEEA